MRSSISSSVKAFPQLWRVPVALAVALALVVTGFLTGVRAQADDPPRVAFVARADNPVDALAASSVAAQLGGVVLLSDSASLSPDAREGLEAFGPDLVVIAGGTVALSPHVEQAVADLGYPVRRVSGASRLSTARQIAGLVDELDLAYLPAGGTARRAKDADTVAGRTPSDLARVAHTLEDAEATAQQLAEAGTPALYTEITAPTPGYLVVRTSLSLHNIQNGAENSALCQPLVTLGDGTKVTEPADPTHVRLAGSLRGVCSAENVFAVPAGEHFAYVLFQADDVVRVHRRSLTVEFVPFDGDGQPPALGGS